MGQYDQSLRLLVVDTDEALRTELRSLQHAGIQVVFVEASMLADPAAPMAERDVIVICVETAAALALVASVCERADAPAVIAIAAAGFDHKPIEHVLLLAEVRGAVATLPKPIEAPELVAAATRAQARFSLRQTHALHEAGVLQNQIIVR